MNFYLPSFFTKKVPQNCIKQEGAKYHVQGVFDDDAILDLANTVALNRLSVGQSLTSPSVVKNHLQTLLQELEYEVFMVLFLNCKNEIIAREEMFRGSLQQCKVYPREVAKSSLHHNAASIVLVHNHPSGACQPSQADIHITSTLAKALALFDIEILDHIVVARSGAYSFAEHGRMPSAND